jgi:hypothetical protein
MQQPVGLHFSLLAILGGCATSDDVHGTNGRDAGDPQAPDDGPDPLVVGSWEPIDSVSGQPIITFHADGTFEAADFRGTYEANGRQLTFHVVDGTAEYSWLTETYHADDVVLLYPAFVPDGPLHGLAGTWWTTWAMEIQGEVTSTQEVLSLYADGSGQVRSTSSGSGPVAVAWSVREQSLVLYYPDSGWRSLYLRGEDALGIGLPLRRIGDPP